MLRTRVIATGLSIAAMLIAVSGASAAAVYMSIPDTTAARGDTLYVPVYSTDVTDSGVYAYQLLVSFDSTFVEIVGVSDEGSLTDVGPWMDPMWHIMDGEDTVRVASAGTSPLSGEGLFVLIGLSVLDSAPSDSSMFLGLHQVYFNEGIPAVSPDGGWLSVTSAGVPGAPGAAGDPFIMERLSRTSVRWSLTGAPVSGARLEIYDAFGRFVTSLGPDSSSEWGRFTWNGENAAGEAVSGGVYFYKLSYGEGVWSGKVCVLR